MWPEIEQTANEAASHTPMPALVGTGIRSSLMCLLTLGKVSASQIYAIMPAMSRTLGIDFPQYFNRELESLADLEADGLVEKADGGLRVTDTGRLFIRNIAMRFDAYITAREENQFSRTI